MPVQSGNCSSGENVCECARAAGCVGTWVGGWVGGVRRVLSLKHTQHHTTQTHRSKKGHTKQGAALAHGGGLEAASRGIHLNPQRNQKDRPNGPLLWPTVMAFR